MMEVLRRGLSKLIRFGMFCYRLRYVRKWEDFFDRLVSGVFLAYVKESGQSVSDFTLASSEQLALEEVWRREVGKAPRNSYYRLTKHFGHGFDPQYIADEIWFEHILPYLQPIDECRVLEDKSKYSFYFGASNRPEEILRRIRGNYYDAENRLLSQDEAAEIICNNKGGVIVKPTVNTGRGEGIRIVDDPREISLEELNASIGQDYTIQLLIQQSAQMRSFNDSSVNTLRVTSLFLNGKFTILSTILRVGGKGNRLDNVAAGGFAVGVDAAGRLARFGYNKRGNRIECDYAGRRLDGLIIQGFARVASFVEDIHKKIPYLPFIGWDIALDETDSPIMIELNASNPGILYEQLCTGPLFGDRFEEVMKFVAEARKRKYQEREGFFRPDARFGR